MARRELLCQAQTAASYRNAIRRTRRQLPRLHQARQQNDVAYM